MLSPVIFGRIHRESMMNNNDVLRRLRYALDLNDATMIEIFALSDHKISRSELVPLLKKEEEEGYVECDRILMGLFLNGLVIHRRGRQEEKPGQAKRVEPRLTNNTILKKIRIALEFKEEDMLGALKLAGVTVSKSELSALFRKEGHKNYKDCGDQFLRNFLKGLSMRLRR